MVSILRVRFRVIYFIKNISFFYNNLLLIQQYEYSRKINNINKRSAILKRDFFSNKYNYLFLSFKLI